jgi:hypothetical protein
MSEDVMTGKLQNETIDQPRRRFFGTAAMTIATAQLGVIASAAAQTGKAAPTVAAIKPGTNTSFKSLKQIDAGLLSVGYAEDGLPMAHRSYCCTVGRTTYTVMSTSRHCWRPRVTGSSSRVFAATARRTSLQATRSAMVSSP